MWLLPHSSCCWQLSGTAVAGALPPAWVRHTSVKQQAAACCASVVLHVSLLSVRMILVQLLPSAKPCDALFDSSCKELDYS
jgi:hypothetical protein